MIGLSGSKQITSDTPQDLYLDVDGTLVRTDLLQEAAWRYVRTAPWRIFKLIFLALEGRIKLKTFLARRTRFDPAIIPYENAILELIEQRKAAGHRTIIVTASHHTYARHIAEHLKLSDGAHGSSNKLNLKGSENWRVSDPECWEQVYLAQEIPPVIAPYGPPPKEHPRKRAL